MKFHRIAALALFAGWYLLMPPAGEHGHYRLSAPLSEWKQIDSYDSAAECGQVLDMAKMVGRTQTQWDDNQRKAMEATRCVSSDDPRLGPPHK